MDTCALKVHDVYLSYARAEHAGTRRSTYNCLEGLRLLEGRLERKTSSTR